MVSTNKSPSVSESDTDDSADDSDEPVDSNVSDEDYFTTNTQVRFALLGSLVSAFIIVSFIALIYLVVLGVYGASLAPILVEYRYVLLILVLTAGGWIFGADLLDAWKK